MRFAHFSLWIWLLVCAQLAVVSHAQQKQNALTQINWVPVTGSGAPTTTSCGGTCSSLNIGLPYTDTLNNNTYVYTGTGPVAGWILSGSGSSSSIIVSDGVSQTQSIVGNSALVPRIFGNSYAQPGFGSAPYDHWTLRLLVDAGLYLNVAAAQANQTQWQFAGGGETAFDVAWNMLVHNNTQSFNTPTVFDMAICGNNVAYDPSDTLGCVQDFTAGEIWSGTSIQQKVIFGTNSSVVCTGTCSTNTDFPYANGITATSGATITWTQSVGLQNVVYLVAESLINTTGSGTFNVACTSCTSGTTPLTDSITGSSTLNPYVPRARSFPAAVASYCPSTNPSSTVICSGIAYRFGGLTPTAPGQQTFKITVLSGTATVLFTSNPLVQTSAAAATGPRLITSNIPPAINFSGDAARVAMNNVVMPMLAQLVKDGVNATQLDLNNALDVPDDYAFNATPNWSGAPYTTASSFAIASNVVTVNLLGTCSGCAAGMKVEFNDCQTATFLNSQWVTALTWTATQITFNSPSSQPNTSTTVDTACQIYPQATFNPQCPTSNNSGHGNKCWQDHILAAEEGAYNAPAAVTNPNYNTVTAKTVDTSTEVINATTATTALQMLWGDNGQLIWQELSGDPGNIHFTAYAPVVETGSARTSFRPEYIYGGVSSGWQNLGLNTGTTNPTPGGNLNSGTLTFTGKALGAAATITAWSVAAGTGGVNTATITANNSFTAMESINISGLTAGSCLNGLVTTVSVSSTSFTFTTQCPAAGTTSDSGQAAVVWQQGLSLQAVLPTGTAPNLNLKWQLVPGAATGPQTGLQVPNYYTNAVCTPSSSSSPPNPYNCAAASAGVVAVPTGATSFTVQTSQITAVSSIFFSLTVDPAVCPSADVPTNLASILQPILYSRSTATSFTFTLPVAPVGNPLCVQYFQMN